MSIKKIITVLLVMALTATAAVGGTLAYLTDREAKANVFTVGDVSIDLKEEFEHASTLVPGVNIEKKPTIVNVGPNDAWVWLEFAIPSALDNAVQGTDQGSNENVIHWNPKGATSEGYVTEERVAQAIADGFFGEMDTTKLTADYINNNKMHWNVFDSIEDGKNMKTATIDGVEYNVYVLLYNKALTPGEETLPNIEKVFLDSRVDIDPDGNWFFVDKGVATPISWNSKTNGNPVIYVSAYAMQKENFANAREAYAAYQKQWGDKGAEYGNPIDADAIVVTNAQELKDAMLIRDAKIVLTDDIVVGADTPLQWGSYMFVANGREMTINLNGHSIIVEEDASLKTNALFTTANGGTLNVQGEGTVEIKNGKSGVFHAMNANDQINVYGGTYISNSDNGSDALAIIYTNSGNVDVYGGKFVSPVNAGHANAENRQGSRLSVVYHEGALLNHEYYYNDSDVTAGRIKLEDGCALEEVTINGETWYKVVKQ